MAHLAALVQFLDDALAWEGYDDSCQNGLQVESSCQLITKVGLAVDSGLSLFEKAVVNKCQLLIVHHGLFWRDSPNLSGIVGQKVRTLIEGSCSLYASHLPLDGHPTLGNNAELIKALGANLGQSFCRSGSKDIGFIGTLAHPTPRADFEHIVRQVTADKRTLVLNFGAVTIKTIAVVTGGAAFAIEEAQKMGADVFITGEPKQSVFHQAKELKMNAIFAGHYATETFGVKAVGRLLTKEFGVEVQFLDEPTDI